MCEYQQMPRHIITNKKMSSKFVFMILIRIKPDLTHLALDC